MSKDITIIVLAFVLIILTTTSISLMASLNDERKTSERQNAENIVYLNQVSNLTAQLKLTKEFGVNATYASCEAMKSVLNQFYYSIPGDLPYDLREFQYYLNTNNCFDLAVEQWADR